MRFSLLIKQIKLKLNNSEFVINYIAIINFSFQGCSNLDQGMIKFDFGLDCYYLDIHRQVKKSKKRTKVKYIARKMTLRR